jgi:hypothetical protein
MRAMMPSMKDLEERRRFVVMATLPCGSEDRRAPAESRFDRMRNRLVVAPSRPRIGGGNARIIARNHDRER